MSSTTHTAPAGTMRVFGRTCAAEWTRLWTVRTTWWFLAAAAVTMVGIGTALGLDSSSSPPAQGPEVPAWVAGSITTMPAQFALLAVVLLAVTSDYASSGIIPTLQWTPRRRILFGARTLVPVVVATASGVALAVAASLAAWAGDPRLRLPLDEGLSIVGWVAFVLATGTTLSVGLGFLFRSTAGGLVSMFLLMLVLPLVLPMLGYAWMQTAAELLPGTGAVSLLLAEDMGMTTTSSVVVLTSWALAALTLGGLRLTRHDADR